MPLLFLLLLALFIYAIFKGLQQNIILANKYHLLDSTSYSSQEFYQTVEELIHSKELRGVSLSRTTYFERGMLSPRREYLRARYQNLVFDICAAPFAKNFFVSWWFSELGTPIHDLLRKIPFLGVFIGKRAKTFFEMDTENIIKESIVQCVDMAIAQMEEAKGIRNHPLLN